VRAGVEVGKAIAPARVGDIFSRNQLSSFNDFDMGVLGHRFIWSDADNIASSGAPMYELYGTVGSQGYGVVTTGQVTSNVHLMQEATTITPTNIVGRKFKRTAVVLGSTNPVWSKWVEVPTLSYSPAAQAIIVDGAAGDDVEGNGTEAKPVKTLWKARDLLPRITLGWQSQIKIKAGTYNIGSSELAFGQFMGGSLDLAAYSGNRDVEIVFSDTDGSKRGMFAYDLIKISVTNLRFVKSPGTKVDTGLTVHTAYGAVTACEFENFNYGIHFEGGARGYVSACKYINCNVALNASLAGLALHSNGTGSGLSYGLRVGSGIIIKSGTQPTGSIADEQVIAGQII
jgi:hypothetical protein